MANAFYGVNVGQGTYDVTVASSTQTKDVEINVNLSNATSKESVLKALKQLEDAIIRNPYTPV